MPTLDLLQANFLAASAGENPPPGHVFAVLGAVALLMFAFGSMRRAVGPFAEILKAALGAVATFLLIAVAVILLLVSLVR
jgi:MYXO-CTERM domain-containing protein